VVTIEVESPKGSLVRLTDDVVVPAASSVEGHIRDNPPTNQMARQALTPIILCVSFSGYFAQAMVESISTISAAALRSTEEV